MTYHADITPQVSMLVENTSIQLTVQYNIQYNVSILPSLCDDNGTAAVVELNFSELTHDLMMYRIAGNIGGN